MEKCHVEIAIFSVCANSVKISAILRHSGPLTGLIFHHRHAQPLPLPPAHNLTAVAARVYGSRGTRLQATGVRSCGGRRNTAPKRERHGNNCVSIANYGLNGV